MDVMKDLIVQIRSMTLRREVFLKVDITFAKQRVLQYLPLEQFDPAIDIFFEATELQRVITEEVLLRLRLKGISDPDEHEICNQVMEVCWSQTARAHMNWKDPSRDLYELDIISSYMLMNLRIIYIYVLIYQ